MKMRREGLVLTCIVALGGIIRFLVALPVLLDPALAIRNDNYMLLASQLLSTGHYTDALYGPGYPVFLAPFIIVSGAYAVFSVILMQVALSTATIYLTASLARAIFNGEALLPLVAAALVAIHPSSIIFTPQILTETLYTFIIMTCMFLLMRRPFRAPHAIVAGLLTGMAALTRGNGLLVGMLIGLLMLITHYRLRRTAIFLLTFILPVLLWSAHNLSVHGHFSPTASGDYNVAALFVGPAKSASEGTPPGATIQVWVKDMDEVPQNIFELSSRVKGMAYRWIMENPASFLKSLLIGQARAFAGPGAADWKRITGAGLGAVYALACMNVFTSALAALGAISLRCRLSSIMLAFIVLITVSHVLPSGTAGQSRFMVPAYPMFAMLAAGGLLYLRDMFTSGSISSATNP